jgi:hypothetical protein
VLAENFTAYGRLLRRMVFLIGIEHVGERSVTPWGVDDYRYEYFSEHILLYVLYN